MATSKHYPEMKYPGILTFLKSAGGLLVLFILCQQCSGSGDGTDPAVVPMGNDGVGQGLPSDTADPLSGEFMDGAHMTTGLATVNALRTQLEVTDFMTEPGPILEFYLATDPAASEYVSLGELKGLEGDFAYDLPDGIDFETHKYLIVWCVDFSVNFGYCILE